MRRSWIGCLLLGLVIGTALAITPVAAQDDHEAARKKLRALRQAAEALQEAGMGEEAARLMQRHEHLEQRLERARGEGSEREHGERHNGEREVAQRLVRAMRLGVEGLARTDRQHAAHNLERALHARQLNLEGRRDEEAREIRHTAPGLGQEAELMALAANVLREQGRNDAADIVAREARRLQEWHKQRRQRSGNQIELMLLAHRQLVAADRVDAANIIEGGIAARRMRYAGRNDEEARDIIRRQPALGHQARALHLAAELLADKGKADHAHRIAQLGRQIGAEARERGAADRERRQHRERDSDDHRGREHDRRGERHDGEHRERADGEHQGRASRRLHRHLERLGEHLEKLVDEGKNRMRKLEEEFERRFERLAQEMEDRMEEFERAFEELEEAFEEFDEAHEL